MQIDRVRGDTYADEFVIKNVRTGAVIDVTGCTAVLTVNSDRNPTDASSQIFQITGILSDPEAGVVQFSPTTEQADQVGTFYYDIQLTDSDGIIRTIMKDVYSFTQDITK